MTAAVLILGLVLSCGGDDGGSEEASGTTTSTTAASSTTSTTTTTATNPSTSSTLALGPLEAGEHSTAGFVPTMTFVVDDGWQVAEDSPRVFALQRGPGAGLVFLHVQSVVTPGSSEAEPPPADLVGWLREHPALTVGPAQSGEVGGRPATLLDIELRRGEATQKRGCADACIELFRDGIGGVIVTEGIPGRVWVAGDIVILADAPTAALADHLAATEELLATVQFAG